MSIALLDVNVLLALFDLDHVHYQQAHHWLSRNRKYGWATCPMTINGCIRILTNPAYASARITASELTAELRHACAAADHHFWPDSVSLLDESLFRTPMISGHQKIADAYLLGLAVRNHGRLATFDRSIPLKAVHGAGLGNLTVLGDL
jgi:toxin-antitoxin system PIN domain toxin